MLPWRALGCTDSRLSATPCEASRQGSAGARGESEVAAVAATRTVETTVDGIEVVEMHIRPVVTFSFDGLCCPYRMRPERRFHQGTVESE